MIKDKLLQIVQNYKGAENRLFLRSLLKEAIQDFILNFVYNHPFYKKLIFTGGSCLRKVYGLPRLSEDLDFDFLEKLKIQKFAQEIEEYFAKKLQYKNLQVKISSREKTVFLKFPILKEIGLAKTPADSPILFARCDFAKEEIGIFKTEVNSISTDEFTFFVLSFDLPTLFANKIITFLEREFFKGKDQKIPFKGRDVFDLVWFLEKSAKVDFSLQPNWQRVFKRLKIKNRKEVWKQLIEKLEKIEDRGVYNDLLPFIQSPTTIENFSKNFYNVIKGKVEYF